MQVKVRFAPSPTGYLHVGNVRVCLLNYIYALQNNGKFVLRIDDTDKERSKKELEEGIKTDLRWLGIEYDEFYRQSERYENYFNAIEKLKSKGLLYPCIESQEELEIQKKSQLLRKMPPVYDRSSLTLSPEEITQHKKNGTQIYWRFKLSHTDISWNDLILGQTTINTKSISDPVLLKPDGNIVYTLASVLDDIEMGITHIIRGQDHVTNTAVQIELFKALDGNQMTFAHMPLLSSSSGQDISKRNSSILSMINLRKDLQLPNAVINSLMSLGMSVPFNENDNLDNIIKTFDFSKISKSSPKFNIEEVFTLTHKIYCKMQYCEIQKHLERLKTYINVDEKIENTTFSYNDLTNFMKNEINEDIWEILKHNIHKLYDIFIWKQILFTPHFDYKKTKNECEQIKNATSTSIIEKQNEKQIDNTGFELNKEVIKKFLCEIIELQKNNQEIQINDIANTLKTKYDFNKKDIFHTIRIAITGLEKGPELQKILEIIKIDEFIKRLSIH